MKKSVAAVMRLTEISAKLKALDKIETRSADQDAEYNALDTEQTKVGKEYREAATAEEREEQELLLHPRDGAPETRERLRIRHKTGLADFFSAAAGGREVTGAAREYADACGVSALGNLPLAIFRDGQPETRDVTPGPAVDGPLRPTVPYVFERSAAASLGIAMPSVPAGQVQIPKITTAPPVDTLAKDGAAPATAAAVSLVSQAPVRIAGQFEVRVEDLSIMPTLEAALSESMQGSLSNELDEQTFNGAAGELNGLLTQATDESAASAVETYQTGIQRFASMVDGRHAYTLADVRAVIGSKTFAHYASIFANSNKGDMSLFDYLVMHLGSIRVSDRTPGVSSSAQRGIVVLTASAEPPKIHVWDSLQIVRDPYSGAGAGKVTITATALVSPLYIPHGTSQVKEIRPKLS